MGKTAVLSVDILADASNASKEFEKAGDAAKGASDKIGDIGDKSGDTATGLGALAGALDAAGFGGAADSLNLVATAMDATEGATILFKVAQESLTASTIKDTAAKVLNTAQTVASTVATTVASAATKVWAGTQAVLNAVMTANPIGLIIAAIVILIGIIVLIATKTTWFQDIWAAAWSGIQSAASAVWSWLVSAATSAWNLLVAGVTVYVGIYVGIFEGIKSAVLIVWDAIKSAAGTALDAILHPIDTVKGAFDNVVDAIKRVIEWLGNIKLPKVLTDIGDAIGGIFGKSAPGAGTRSVGVPLGVGPGATGLSAGAMSTGGAGVTINITGALDPVAVARQIRQILGADQRRRGGVVIA
jgi:hypothetical protein